MFVRASSSQTFLVVNQTSNTLKFHFPVNLHLGHENNLLPIWLSPVNYKIKFSHIKLGLQYTWLYMYFEGYISILIIILNNWTSFVKTDIFSVVEVFFQFLKIVVTLIRYVLLTKNEMCWHLMKKVFQAHKKLVY